MSDNLRIWSAVEKTNPIFGDMRIDQKFWDKCSINDSGCWVWSAAKTSSGYGVVVRRPERFVTHRYAYEKLIGPVPAGLDCDHLCRNRACCNPAHIEPVTRAENVRRGVVPSKMRARFSLMTHCLRGHEFTDSNTWIDTRGHRVCRSCRAIYDKKRRSR